MPACKTLMKFAFREEALGGSRFVAVHVAEGRSYGRIQKAIAICSTAIIVAFVAVSLVPGQDRGSVLPLARSNARSELAMSEILAEDSKEKEKEQPEDTTEGTVNKVVDEDTPLGFSIEPRYGRSFTGHSAGKEGTPLTFGKGTYFNVFDPNPHQLTCDPGQFGPGGKDCKECEVNFWCPGGQMKVDCPENTISLPGAYKKSNCICKPGHYGATYEGCKPCPADSYCPGGVDMNPCPPMSSSPPMAFECTCDPGNYGDLADQCKQCPAGSVCTGGSHILSCPDHSTSLAGSKNVTDCTCSPGYFEPVANGKTVGPDCVTCPENHFCPGGATALPCPANTVAPRVSSHEGQCTCAAGYYGTDPKSCTACPKGFWCPGGASAQPCPANSYSAQGASKMADCTCIPGYVGDSPEQCRACPAGSFCTGGNAVQACPQFSTSDEGSSKCACAPGYRGTDPLNCALCAHNSYCPGEGKQKPCPSNTVAGTGKDRERYCQCVRGFYGTGGTDCNVCPTGKYCPTVGGVPRTCPDHSMSKAGTEKAADCVCNAGYYNSRSLSVMNHLVGPECQVCSEGYYCPGGGKRERCPAKTTAPAGSTVATQCRCDKGYYGKDGKCQDCPVGSYCEGGEYRRDCPVRTTGPLRARALSDCICDRGYYGSDPNKCKRCPKNSYCPGGSSVRACPERAEAAEGAHKCTCKAGYYGSNPFQCRTCRRNYYCQGGHVTRCPRYSRSPYRARSVDACKCAAGYRRLTDDQGIMSCGVCPSGSYCPGNSQRRTCPKNKNSNRGARYKRQCGCVAGYYDGGVVPSSNFAWVYTGQIEIKTAGRYVFCITSDDGSRLFIDGTYRVNNDGLHGTRRRCSSVTVSSGKHDIKVDGFQAGGHVSMWFKYRGPDTNNVDKFARSVMDNGKGKKGWNLKMYRARYFIRRMPDVKRLHYIGETTLPQIYVPVAGRAGRFRSYITARCRKCIAGHYCTGAFPTRRTYPYAHLRRCPGYRWTSKTTAISYKDCTECRPGYYGADYRRCRACPRGYFCPGGTERKECPAGSATVHWRRSAQSQCVCKPGFERKPGGKPWECQPCSKGFYCWGYGGRHRRACPSGSTNAPGQRHRRTCMCAPGMYGGRGGRCYTCQSRYYCPGNGRRYYCHHRASSPRGSTSRSQCFCPHMKSQFPTIRKSQEPSECQKYHCRTISKCDLQRWCSRDRYCRGFTFPKNKMRGFGCKVRGLKKCLGKRKPNGAVDFYEKAASRQMTDTVRLMRRLRMSVPECPKVGQPAVLFQHCWPRSYRGWQWKSVLYQGEYPYPHSRHCDNDRQLCVVRHCGLRGGDLSSMDIPANMKVEVYSSVNFGGSKLTLYGPMNADHNCMTKFSMNGRRSWNDRARSVKVLPK